MFDIWKISDNYTFHFTNLILIGLVIACYYFGKRFITKKLRGNSNDKGLVIKGKEYSLEKLNNQLFFILGIFFLYGAIVYGNPKFSISNIFSFELIGFETSKGGSFHLNLGQIISCILVFLITKFLISLLRIIIYKAFKNKEWIDDARKYTITQLSRYIIYTISLIIILKILFGDISNILWAGSALFVGLGLGMQDFFTDLVSGFILLNDGSIKVGDIVELNGHIAKVEKISIRTSHVKTTEGKTIIVPNSKFTEEYLTNWSISDKVTRFHIDVSVAYGSDTKLVKDILYQTALNHPMVEKNQDVIIMFNNFGDNGLEFQLYFWAKRTWDILVIKSDIRFEIDQKFRDNGIRIPFPQRDLHIISSDNTNSDNPLK